MREVQSLHENRDAAGLLEALEDEDDKVRSKAARALGQISDARAVEALAKGLKDTSVIVRTSTARALGSGMAMLVRTARTRRC